MLGVVAAVQCIVTADIVEFDFNQSNSIQIQDAKSTSSLSEVNQTHLKKQLTASEEQVITSSSNSINNKLPISVGDKVRIINYFNSPVDGTVTEIKGDNYIVNYVTKSGEKTKQVKVRSFQVERIN